MMGNNKPRRRPEHEDAESKRKRRMERNERLRMEREKRLESSFKTIADKMRREGATDEEIQRKQNSYRRFSEPFGTHVWHADGTPYAEEDYIRAGMEVPLDVDEQKPIQVAPKKV